jgi:hypothetical protein
VTLRLRGKKGKKAKKTTHSIKQSINLLLLTLELELNTTLPILFQKQPF